jgi:phospholipid-translocating ATPase
MVNRDQSVRKVIDQLESDMELLGITGVEDKLQEDIRNTLDALRNAGISVWMITGDKIETATCIAISAGLKAPFHDTYVIKDQTEPYSLQNKLNEFSMKMNTVLIIDGASINTALNHQKEFFYNVACNAPAVVCCRVSPTQKAVITEGVKIYTNKIVLGIGDGGNDVGMIQAADVGVGIVGKEGKQAALASDFSILKFKHLSKLLLWHGRLSYKNTSLMSQFVIHRGLIISIIQTIFSLVFYSIAIPIYNGYLMLGYTTVYTMFPVFCIVFDEDVDEAKAMDYPQLYQSLQKGRELNIKTFLIWLWKSIYQGSIIMFLSFTLFENTFIDIVTITFTALIIIELLNVYTTLTRINKIVLISQILTFVVYIASIILFQQYIDVSVMDFAFAKKVALIVVLSWLPMHMVKLIRQKYDPTENEKIMKDIK